MKQPSARTPIRTLSGVLANQIAAGEVVERPASVVKELVENALDAGATRVDILLEAGGTRRIRVRDDGFGIPSGELALSLSRHATSKIESVDDLDRIASMGFRGEALPSIASVSRLVLESRPRDAAGGARVRVDGGEVSAVEPAASKFGSAVEVRDLFFNVPARRKFLRTPRTEVRHAEDMVRRFALSWPDVSFTLHHDNRRVLDAPRRMEPLRRLSRLLGEAFASVALETSFEADGLSMHGFLTPPSAARARPDHQYLFVNRRSVRDDLVRHAVRVGFGDALAGPVYPGFVLHMGIDPAAVDVNVHPTKHEIRFREPRHVHDFVRHAVARTLGGIATQTPPKTDSLLFESGAGLPNADGRMQHGPGAVLYADGSGRSGAGQIRGRSAPYAAPLLDPQSSGACSSRGRVRLGDYVLVEDRDRLLLVDLATGRGALVQERLERSSRTGDAVSRPLLIPLTQSVSEPAADAVDGASASLRSLGIEIRRAAPGALALRSIPACLAGVAPEILLDAVAKWAQTSGAVADLSERLAGVAQSRPFDGDTRDIVEAALDGRLDAATVTVDEAMLGRLVAAQRR